MLYLDNRLSKALSENRLEQPRHLHERHALTEGRRQKLKHRLGRLVVAKGEKLAGRQAGAV